jgi:hypothetical protein
VIAIWLGSIIIYACDYRLGLKWLFFLGFTHVLLEFPLNHLTLINIGREMGASVSRSQPGRQGATSAVEAASERSALSGRR